MSGFLGHYLDGQSAGRHQAEVSADGPDMVIRLPDAGETLRWPLDQIRALRDMAGPDRMILRIDGADPRLVLEDAATIRWVLQVCPALDAQARDPIGARRMVVWAGGAVVSLALLIFVVIPFLAEWLTPLVPERAEIALGRQIRNQAALLFTDADTDQIFCTDPAGEAALRDMVDRLVGDRVLPHVPQVAIVSSEVVNAFAAPGGQMVVLSALIDQAETPDEVAAVMAHELGHLAARDPMRLAMRSAGSAGVISLVMGDFLGGGVLAAIGSQLLDAHYSRAAETAADAYAAEMLLQAGVSPQALARFFERLKALEGAGPLIPPYFSTHPPTAQRIDALSDTRGSVPRRPILSDHEWAALRAVCDSRSDEPPDGA